MALGTVGHLASLRRTEASGFSVEEASSLGDLEEAGKRGRPGELVIPMAEALRTMKKLALKKERMELIARGRFVERADLPGAEDAPIDSHVALVDDDGTLLAIARVEKDVVQPIRVFIEGRSK